RQEGDRDHLRTLLDRGAGDVARLHLRVARVEHHDLVAVRADHGREGLHAEGRERHDFDVPVRAGRAAVPRRQQAIEVLIAYVDQEYFHLRTQRLGQSLTAPRNAWSGNGWKLG